MPPSDKPLHRLKCLLEACARRDARYQEALTQAARAAGLTPAELANRFDFSQWPDATLLDETRHHLQSMLTSCVYRSGPIPDLHQRLQAVERAMP